VTRLALVFIAAMLCLACDFEEATRPVPQSTVESKSRIRTKSGECFQISVHVGPLCKYGCEARVIVKECR
jgi:hypothetical protein